MIRMKGIHIQPTNPAYLTINVTIDEFVIPFTFFFSHIPYINDWMADMLTSIIFCAVHNKDDFLDVALSFYLSFCFRFIFHSILILCSFYFWISKNVRLS